MTNLKVQLSVQIPSGPTLQSARTVEAASLEPFTLSIQPNKGGDASAGIDCMPKSSEGPIKLLMVQSNIYPVGEDAIKMTVENTPITAKPLHEPLLLLGAEMIASLGENIAKISFVNTYQLSKPTEKDIAVKNEAGAKEALEAAKTKETTAIQTVENAKGTEGEAGEKEALEVATTQLAEAEKALKAANDEAAKASVAVEKEIAEHTAQLSILIGREAPSKPPAPTAETQSEG